MTTPTKTIKSILESYMGRGRITDKAVAEIEQLVKDEMKDMQKIINIT